MRIVILLVLYAIFSFAGIVAGLVGIIGALFSLRYTSNIMHSLDSLLAALLGWDGRSTVSKECGRSDCRFCRFICAVLDRVLEKDHCAKEARQ